MSPVMVRSIISVGERGDLGSEFVLDAGIPGVDWAFGFCVSMVSSLKCIGF